MQAVNEQRTFIGVAALKAVPSYALSAPAAARARPLPVRSLGQGT